MRNALERRDTAITRRRWYGEDAAFRRERVSFPGDNVPSGAKVQGRSRARQAWLDRFAIHLHSCPGDISIEIERATVMRPRLRDHRSRSYSDGPSERASPRQTQ